MLYYITKEYNYSLKNNIKGKRNKYSLKPYISSIILGEMGDIIQYMAIQISVYNSNFNLQDRDQLTVLLSCTNYGKNSLFI